jgi:hypothetical protein
VAITAKSVVPKILKNTTIENGIIGKIPDEGKIVFDMYPNTKLLKKENLLPYPKPLTKFLATSANLAASENDKYWKATEDTDNNFTITNPKDSIANTQKKIVLRRNVIIGL